MNSERYQLSFHALDLPNKKWFGASSPYVEVKITSGPQKGKVVGQTEPVPNTLNPDWVKILCLDFSPREVTNLEVTIWDYTGDGKEPRWLGEANFEATSVYQEAGNTKSVQIGRKEKSR
jgi:Ca2+-dependent lipid-binding protein